MLANHAIETQPCDKKMTTIFRPKNQQDVQELFKTASKIATAISVYGSAEPDGIKLELAALNRILEIDAANLVATVEPGLQMAELNVKLHEHGLRFVPAENPFYRGKTVGEFFYEGCSNISSLKYGPAKHFLMGSDIVLPTGQLLKTGGKTVKNVTGYDLTRFFNAPFANLGVTVKFLLKLLPRAETRKAFVAYFQNTLKLFAFIDQMRQAKIVPAYLVWVDPYTQSLSNNTKQDSIHMVFGELDGIEEDVGEQWAKTSAILNKLPAETQEDLTLVTGEMLKWQHVFAPAKDYALTDELKFRYTDQAAFLQAFYALKENKMAVGLFGQIAEGKLNVYFGDRTIPDLADVVEILSVALQSGGYSSGKYYRLSGLALTDSMLAVEKTLKKMIDPADVLKG
jgi:glycolate oxidase